jgi:hypothetical protein
VHPVINTNSVFRMNMSSANTYSSIVDTLVNNADWFFPGGECTLCLVVTEISLCGRKMFTRIMPYRNSDEMRNQFLFLFYFSALPSYMHINIHPSSILLSPLCFLIYVCLQVREGFSRTTKSSRSIKYCHV